MSVVGTWLDYHPIMESMKSLGALWLRLTQCAMFVEYVTPKDRETFQRRLNGEGLPFLTTVLPRLGKELDRAFRTGRLAPVPGFDSAGGAVYPAFLSGAWKVIFEKDGQLRSQEEAGAVSLIRQLSYLFYKLEVSYTPEQEAKALTAFIAADEAARAFAIRDALCEQLTVARSLVHQFLASCDPRDITPVHGSGSSACGVPPWERYDTCRYSSRIQRVYPYDSHFFYNLTHCSDNLDDLLGMEEAFPVSKVCFVPKDSRGPRIISMEPREHMFIQQGLMTKLYDHVSNTRKVASMIDFRDQTRNQLMARKGSIDGSYATLDLAEASDRLSGVLVKHLFPSNWVEALYACRSSGTILPDGTFRRFWKFAPMGSAVCFPVEAICFWAISLAACGLKERDIPCLLSPKRRYRGPKISVFGDDIIVPNQHAEAVCKLLSRCGLKVNTEKSFWTGPFRESCGGDYYYGHNVTPVRLKALTTDDNVNRYRVAETVNTAIRRYGYWNVGVPLTEWYEETYGPVPVSNRYDDKCEKTSDGLYIIGPYTSVPNRYRVKWCRNTHRLLYRVRKVTTPKIGVATDGWSKVLRRTLLRLTPEQRADNAALPKRPRLKYGWVEL